MTTQKFEHALVTSRLFKSNGKKILLVHLRYPYGKNRIYMNGSLVVTAARLLEAGFHVEFIDFNMFTEDRILDNSFFFSALKTTDYVGISVTGSPSLPDAISCAQLITNFDPRMRIIIGGQVISELLPEQFNVLFSGTNSHQVHNDEKNLHAILGLIHPLVSPYNIPYTPAFNRMGSDLLRTYLSNEITLVVSQGCKFSCSFCAAPKGRREQHVRFDHFRNDLYYLAGRCHEFGIKKLECYASSLDFFQHPEIIIGHLRVLAEVREITGIRINVRCLTCMSSFLNALKEIEDLDVLLRKAGIWCIGFGVDGADVNVWKSQNKFQNKDGAFNTCAQVCKKFGIRAEMLMVIGFPQDTFISLLRAVWISLFSVICYSNVIIRPYLAKKHIPGNEGWKDSYDPHRTVSRIIKNPNFFYNLDFCAFGSKLTHPHFFHRLISNTAYCAIIFLLTPFGRCTTSPLFPQGGGGIGGWFAKQLNKLMPFDR